MTAGAHLAVEPAAYCYPLRRIKVFGRSDTASMHRDRTIAETFQQRIDRLCVRRVGRDIINAEIDECGRKDEQECCQHTDERPTRPVSPKRFLVHSHLLAISCVVRLRNRAARLRQSSWWWDHRHLLVRSCGSCPSLHRRTRRFRVSAKHKCELQYIMRHSY